jgi:glycosyltransferase involved in cell wall biosynthesis
MDSIASVRAQDPPADEVVLVHSGPHDPTESIEQAGVDIPIHVSHERLSTGAARNVGIQKTNSPIVAFLAADCEAAPGWIRNRLRHHERHEAVASAIAPVNDKPLALAYHAYRYATRDPEVAVDFRKLYGVSYRRNVFDRFGVFQVDLYYGEDTEFIHRISPEIQVAWAPDVVTHHRPPRSALAQWVHIFRQVRRRKWFLTTTAGGYAHRDLVGEALYRFRAGRGIRARLQERSLWCRVRVTSLLWTFIGAEIMAIFIVPTTLDG